MDNSKQTEIVKKALLFETKVAKVKKELNALLTQKYVSAPQPPVRETVTRTYPEIVPKTEFDWKLALIPCIFFLPWIFIYYFCIYRKNKQEEIERIKNSDEYKAQCAAADAEFDKQQEILDKKYQTLKSKYDNEILPKYKEELNVWTARHNQEISTVKAELNNYSDTLCELYASTKIIPLQYRSIEALQYIYNLMSTSEYVIKEAIEMYDRQKQRTLDEARLYEQQRANRLADQQNALIDEQNDLIDIQNDISNKARRDANVAGAASFIQRHNINKNLKNIKKKK